MTVIKIILFICLQVISNLCTYSVGLALIHNIGSLSSLCILSFMIWSAFFFAGLFAFNVKNEFLCSVFVNLGSSLAVCIGHDIWYETYFFVLTFFVGNLIFLPFLLIFYLFKIDKYKNKENNELELTIL